MVIEKCKKRWGIIDKLRKREYTKNRITITGGAYGGYIVYQADTVSW